MIRHQSNSNLTLHFEEQYQGLPIQFDKGPFIREYLERLNQTVTCALDQYKRVFAFRFDLRFPDDLNQFNSNFDNQVIDRFTESFKAKIRHNRQMAKRENKYAHDTVVRYVWTREVGQLGRPHYHFAVLLNYDAFCSLGKFEAGRDNMFNRVQEAWASALARPVSTITGVVHFPANPYYLLHREDTVGIDQFFERTSYMCKAATKEFGNGYHGFGASRL
jgi:hypothetical protein